jgi:hypothetical protein
MTSKNRFDVNKVGESSAVSRRFRVPTSRPRRHEWPRPGVAGVMRYD